MSVRSTESQAATKPVAGGPKALLERLDTMMADDLRSNGVAGRTFASFVTT